MQREAKDNVLMIIVGVAFFLNVLVMNIFPPTIEALVLAGYIVLGIGALFVVLSLITLIRKTTSNIITSGIYSVVRHPMYLGGIVMFFSHSLMGQHWIVVIGTIVGIVCCYLIVLSADQRNTEKFGDEYRRYMQSVPRLNILAGIATQGHRGNEQ